MDKITFSGVGLKAYAGVAKNGRPYAFVALRGSAEDGRAIRVIISDPILFAAIAGGARPLDVVEANGTIVSRTFVGADGAEVTVNETVNPIPVGLKPSAFVSDAKWPAFPAMPDEAEITASATEAAF